MSGGADPNSPYVKALINAGMSSQQAIDFANTYTVVDQYNDPVSGSSVTLFDNGGTKYFAIRGTDPNNLGTPIDVIADIGVFEGLNGQQQYFALQSYYQSLIASGTLSASTPLTVTGHSLGGLLAQMFAVDYPSAVSQVTTFNAPGVGGIWAQILQLVGLPGSVPMYNVTNIYAQPGMTAETGDRPRFPLHSGLSASGRHRPSGYRSIACAVAAYDCYVDMPETRANVHVPAIDAGSWPSCRERNGWETVVCPLFRTELFDRQLVCQNTPPVRDSDNDP